MMAEMGWSLLRNLLLVLLFLLLLLVKSVLSELEKQEDTFVVMVANDFEMAVLSVNVPPF